jgi:hypothetical protein
LYNEFAKSMVDAGLCKGDYIAVGSPHIWENIWHQIEDNFHNFSVHRRK